MPDITLDHIRAAAEWAKQAVEPRPLDGQTRRYDQRQWDCQTSCCMWGAASLLSGNGPAQRGPSEDWAEQSLQHVLIAGLLRSVGTTPDQVLDLLSGADLSGADLSGADLSEADLREADLRGANLRGADLREADLRGANLREANLREADLSGADLSGADLSEADLRGAKMYLGNRLITL